MPAAIERVPVSIPVTVTGTLLEVVFPSPSWPLELEPQQRVAPEVITTQA